MHIADHIAALHMWGAFGATLRHASSTWRAARALTAAARESVKDDASRLDSLLKDSEAWFHPLNDPFSVDLGLHRWLEPDREEVYSDWLAWVASQAATSEVFRLFGLEPLPGVDCAPAIERERCIPYGHEGRRGRLDIIVRFDRVAMIVVEIKKGDADVADVEKHAGYKRWINEQSCPTTAVLIASAGEREDYEGFRTVEWATVCVQARCIAARLCVQKKYTTAAMILGFIAAVEQNLLGFSAERVQMIRDGKAGLFNPAVVDHLQRFVDEVSSANG